ncbi:hypothetical protein FUAX_17210 [Fulvitalea axinellae]|uniref:Uncharacterized protein n=1 Tax=Fulvitalea axinellae TaxID=1182444 RepID=A0AAU9D497_9BACT|nr:hypothetical protein FUAX_17210 [Fulvitalea axinellae]
MQEALRFAESMFKRVSVRKKSGREASAGERCVRGAVPSAEAVVQRAVGFEIEKGAYRFFRSPEHYHEMTAALWDGYILSEEEIHGSVRFRKGDILLEGDGFTVQADISVKERWPYMEIVTDPFEETPEGYAKLTATMAKLTRMMARVKREPGYIWLSNLKEFGALRSEHKEAVMKTRGSEEAYFQVTAGLGLDKLGRLFDDLGYPDEEETEAERERKAGGRSTFIPPNKSVDPLFRYRSQLMVREVDRTVRRLADRAPMLKDPQLMGLLRVVGMYLMFGSQEVGHYPKSFVPVLARTDVATMFEKLPRPLKATLRNYKANLWRAVVDDLCGLLGIGGLSARFFARGVYQYHTNLAMRNMLGKDLTRDDWVSNLPFGKDLLTEKHYPDRHRAYLFRAMGGMGAHMDKDSDKTGAPVFEFRKINKDVPFSEWQSFGQSVFKYIYALNRGEDKAFGEDVEISSTK